MARSAPSSQKLNAPVAVDGTRAQGPDARDLQGDAFEQQHREEQRRLVAGDPAPDAAARQLYQQVAHPEQP